LIRTNAAILLGSLALSGLLFAENVNSNDTGLQLSIAADLLGEVSTIENGGGINRLDAREAEIGVMAPIDPYLDGYLSMAAHREDDEYVFEPHEIYLSSSKFIPRSRIRAGLFFLGIGRLNQFHRHDWAFTSAPKVQREFFGVEAASDAGIEYSWLTPLPFYLELRLGVTSGWAYGHAHGIGTQPNFPTHYLRATYYNDLFSNGGIQTGLNYLGRRNSSGQWMTLLGIDLTAKWRQDRVLTFLLQSEFWRRQLIQDGTPTETTIGYYLFPQYGINPSMEFGIRFDGYAITSQQDALGNAIANFDYAIVPTLSYHTSEFATLRLSYHHSSDTTSSIEIGRQRFIQLQAVFILGAHPAHDF